MKWYLASRTRHQKALRDIATFLEKRKHTISSHWIYKDTGTVQNEKESYLNTFAIEVHDAIKQSDIFILISDKEGTDMFVELGIALEADNVKKIYVVGEYGKRSVMQHHPSITHVKSIKEVFDAFEIDSSKFETPFFT